MSESFPSRLIESVEDIEHRASDKVHKLAFLIPSYSVVSATFFYNFVQLFGHYAHRTGWYPPFQFQKGPYVDQNMRQGVRALLREPEWERLMIVEIDMILPPDAIMKHALHTDDIVGSMYFQHAAPFRLNAMGEKPNMPEGNLAHFIPEGVKLFLDEPNLYRVHGIGLGCTSIARHVFERWDPGIPIFETKYSEEANSDDLYAGTISHDVHFCLEAVKQGFKIWLDSSIRCKHLTEGMVSEMNYIAANPETFIPKTKPIRKKIHVP